MSSIDSFSPYRVQGTIASMAELAKKKPDMVYKMPDELVAEAQLHDEQLAARREANLRYAQQYPDKIYAQVTAGGKIVATVFDFGVTHFHEGTYGASLTEEGEGLALANARIEDILKAVKGEVSYDNFVAPDMGVARGAPEAALPKLTARSLMQIMQDLDWQLVRAQADGRDAPAA